MQISKIHIIIYSLYSLYARSLNKWSSPHNVHNNLSHLSNYRCGLILNIYIWRWKQGFWSTPRDAQGFFVLFYWPHPVVLKGYSALHSEITPGSGDHMRSNLGWPLTTQVPYFIPWLSDFKLLAPKLNPNNKSASVYWKYPRHLHFFSNLSVVSAKFSHDCIYINSQGIQYNTIKVISLNSVSFLLHTSKTFK